MQEEQAPYYTLGAKAYPSDISWGMSLAHNTAFVLFDSNSATSQNQHEYFFLLRSKARHIAGVKTYVIKPRNKSDKIIYYIHGGAYVKSITVAHVNMLVDFANKSGATIYIPLYTLAGDSIFPQPNNEIYAVYCDLMGTFGASNMHIMGDSVGATFSLSLMHQLRENALPQPKLALLIAPVIDLHLSNSDIPAYEKQDRLLSIEWLQEAVEKYLGQGYDKSLLENPLVSPHYIENLKELAPTLYITGDKDLLFPDGDAFAKRAKEEGMDITYIRVKGGFHAFPLSPKWLVPEAVIARKQMLSFFNHK